MADPLANLDVTDHPGGDAVTYLAHVMQAGTIEEIWALHVDCMARFGFDRLLYAFTRFRTPTSLGSPDDSMILSNHHPDYISEFVHGGLYHSAPMVRWSADNVGAMSWSLMAEAMQKDALTRPERRVAEFNARYKVCAGYSISFHDVSVRSKGGIGLCARPGLSQEDVDKIWQEHGREILVMNNVVHLRISALPYVSRKNLTARQREALEWVGDGKTTQDIATIMGLTPATIEKHLRLARDVLDVETTAQAVLKAAFRNQIFVVPQVAAS
ncbi:MAG: LuxR family transcriptional regulator [Albidovulum sp.]